MAIPLALRLRCEVWRGIGSLSATTRQLERPSCREVSRARSRSRRSAFTCEDCICTSSLTAAWTRCRDPERPEKKEPNGLDSRAPAPASKDANDEPELSEEDAALKSELEMLVERLRVRARGRSSKPFTSADDMTAQEPKTELYRPALESLRSLIRTSTSSMVSVPKPLKFLRPHYAELQRIHESWPESSTAAESGTREGQSPASDKALFADILSVLAMTYADTGNRDTLRYRLKGGSKEDPGLWGHEYVRHLAAELGEEFASRSERDENTDDLLALALRLVPFLLTHNAEADAVDLLLELESIHSIVSFVDADTYARVCLYMVSCTNLLVPPDDREVLKTAREIYRSNKRFTESLVLSIRLNDQELIQEDFDAPPNPAMKRQLAYILARQQVSVQTDDEAILEILGNTKLSQHFMTFGKELNVVEPKSLEDIYKSHLEETRTCRRPRHAPWH